MRLGLVLLALLVAVAIAGDKPPANPATAHPPARLSIASGILYSSNGAAIQLHAVNAEIQDGNCHGTQDKPGEKCINVQTGSAIISDASLSKLLNQKLAGRGLKDIQITEDKGKAKITGKAEKLVTVPFTVEGPVSLTNEGYIRLQTESVKVAKLPGLADLLGVDPQKMAGNGSVKGIRADKNGITFDPDLLWGMSVQGKVTRVLLQHNSLVLMFGQTTRLASVRHTAQRRTNAKSATAEKSSRKKK